MTFDVGILSLSPTLGTEMTYKKKNSHLPTLSSSSLFPSTYLHLRYIFYLFFLFAYPGHGFLSPSSLLCWPAVKTESDTEWTLHHVYYMYIHVCIWALNSVLAPVSHHNDPLSQFKKEESDTQRVASPYQSHLTNEWGCLKPPSKIPVCNLSPPALCCNP